MFNDEENKLLNESGGSLQKAFRRANCNLHSPLPVELHFNSKLAMQMRKQAEIWHVIIDYEPLIISNTITPKTQQIFVPNPSKNFNFYSKFHLCL